jgi:hypothetical protein
MDWIWVQLENSFFTEDVIADGVATDPDSDIDGDPSYRITVTQTDGEEKIFTLTGYQLYDLNRNRAFTLSHDQWEGLLEALGLIEGGGM